jgi:molecular chaperone DnaK
MVQEAEEHASDDKKLRETVEIRNQAESVIHMTEKNLKEFGDQISEEERTSIEADMEALREAKGSEDIAAITEKVEALSQSAMKLGEAMYKASQAEGMESQEGGGGDENGATVVDAEFEEVGDEDKEPAAKKRGGDAKSDDGGDSAGDNDEKKSA